VKKKDKNLKGITFKEDEDEKYPQNVTEIQKKKSVKITKGFTVLALVLVVCVAVFAFWGSISPTAIVEYIKNLTGNYGESVFPVSYSQGSFKDVSAMGSDLGVLTDTSFILYSPAGSEILERQHGFSNPQIVSSAAKAIIYSVGGKEFKVETSFNESNDTTMQYGITTAAVNSAGYYAIVTSSHDYLSEMTVYNPDNKNIFKWFCAQGRIISCTLSPDNNHVAAIVLASDNGDIKSDIIIYDLNSKKYIADKAYSGVLLFSVQYKDSSSLSVVGDSESLFLDDKGNKRSAYSYSDKTLKCYYNSSSGTSLAFSRYGIGKESTVISLDDGGKIKGQINISAEIKQLSADNDYITALTPSGLDYFSTDCKNIETVNTIGDIIKTICIKNNVYIFTPATVYHSTLKKK
jgi:hypothetical protein